MIETFIDSKDNRDTCIVTKYSKGGNLFALMKKLHEKTIPESTLRKLFKQMAIGVKGLHERNILHRDIKFGNILVSDLSENAEIKIADLGISV